MMPRAEHSGYEFDIAALFDALDEKRRSLALSWHGVAKALWIQSVKLNMQRDDHPIGAATITGMAKRMDTTRQHALFMLRWLERSPESFIPGLAFDAKATALPVVDSNRRLRWNLQELYIAVDRQRREQDLTWKQLAHSLRCTPSQLTGIGKARFAIGMRLAMRIVVWLDRPARDFIYAATW